MLRAIDAVSGGVLLGMAVLAPWMLGTTTRETSWVLNGLGFLSGGLWLARHLLGRRRGSSAGARSGTGTAARRSAEAPGVPAGSGSSWPMVCVWGLVVTLLAYVLCSALNPRASLQYTFTEGHRLPTGVEIESLEAIEGLPQTHDRDRTLWAFWKYLAIAISFGAARDWLMGASRRERRAGDEAAHFPTDRMQWLLWTLSLSSAALALEGMLQRLDGTPRLLWTVVNTLNGGHGAFGPYPYRSNGAQYLNLMWPVILGFWWVLRRRNVARRTAAHRSGGDPHVLLLVLAALTAAGVVVANSRGGVLVLVGLLVSVVVLVVVRTRRQWGFKLAVLATSLSVLALGGWLGGEAIWKRFSSEDLGNMSGRKLIYADTFRMARDFAVFGSGAETFSPLYFFYRKDDPYWNAYVHDDFLETWVTFGGVGLGLIVLVFLALWLVPFFGKGIPAPPEFLLMLGVAMAGILAHAKFDFPFQVHSLHFEFVLLCALLTSLKWR